MPRGQLLGLLAALLALLLAPPGRAAATAAAAAAGRRLVGDEQAPPPPGDLESSVPAQFVVTNSTLGALLRRTASPRDKAVIFTTTRLPQHPEAELAMLSNFCSHLDAAGVLGFTLLLTVDAATWHALHARGFPAILDRAFPERPEYRAGAGTAPDTPNRVFDVQKHWWGAAIVAHGHRALYMDSDAIVLQDPLPHFAPQQYDVQSISDWSGDSPTLPRVGDALTADCQLYARIPDPRAPGGSVLREWWRYGPGDKERALRTPNPCASTGTWFLEPTPMTVRFTAVLRDRLLAPETRFQWDQTAWNEAIIPFLWGVGEEPPLRYRLLPPASFFGGVGNYESRLAAGLAVDPIILHSGGQHGDDKRRSYERLGLWRPDFRLRARPAPGVGGPAGAEQADAPAKSLAAPEAVLAVAAATRGGHSALLLAAAVLAVVGLAACTAALVQQRRAARHVIRLP